MDIVADAPAAFTPNERACLRALVAMGGEVDGSALRTNIENAKALVFGRISGELKAVAALKQPQASYRKTIGAKAAFDLDEESYPYELGYVFVLPEARRRGGSYRLVASALEHADGRAVFATARIDNEGMLRTLDRSDFVPAGVDYLGRGKRMIRLLVRASATRER